MPDGAELVRFLFDRWNEDEARANWAMKFASPDWRLADDQTTVLWWPPSPQYADYQRSQGAEVTADRWAGQKIENSGDRIAPHIAQWPPRRVLALCAASKALLRAYATALADVDTSDEERRRCEWTLLMLAAPFSGHPEFRPEWRLPDEAFAPHVTA